MRLPWWAWGLVLAACVSGAPEGEPSRPRTAPASPPRLTVFAAASLKDAFSLIGEDFQAARAAASAPVTVAFSFAGSQTLRAQIEQGAPADVFAAADLAPVRALHGAGFTGAPVPLAENDLVFVAPAAPASPTLEALAARGRLVVATPEAPLGRYTEQMFSRFDPALRGALAARIVSRELDARQVLGKVLLGEADAAVVYRSDAASAGPRLAVIEPPPGTNVRTALALAVVTRTPDRPLAEAFAAFVTGPAGQARLRAAGFVVGAPLAGPTPPAVP